MKPKRRVRTAAHETGTTLIETLAATIIGSLILIAAGYLWTNSEQYTRQLVTVATPLADSSNIYWTVEELAQNATSLGTQSLTPTDGFYEQIPGATSGSVPILTMNVTTLQGIVPSDSAVYETSSNGGSDYVCLAVVPVAGVPMLALFPGGQPYDPTTDTYPPASEVTPIGNATTSYAGTTFSVLPATSGVSQAVQFQMNVTAAAVNADGEQPGPEASNPRPETYSFMIGEVDY